MICSCKSPFMLPGDGQALHHAFKKLKRCLVPFTDFAVVIYATSYWNYVFWTVFPQFPLPVFIPHHVHLSFQSSSGDERENTGTFFFPLFPSLSSLSSSTTSRAMHLTLFSWLTLWKLNEAGFSDCFLGEQNVCEKRPDPSEAVELRQLNFQSSKFTGRFGQAKTSKHLSHTSTKASLFFDCCLLLPDLMNNINRFEQCCWKLHCSIYFLYDVLSIPGIIFVSGRWAKP